ncbi:MAG: hypothetical protein KF767_18315 [Bdellovibrionaceae bacterium]|nr:hypothetical protein [Pseudobdellovibrionaceae bacterium]
MNTKFLLSSALFLTGLTMTSPAFATAQPPAEPPSVGETAESLFEHLDKLRSLNPRTCPADYRKFRAVKDLTIDLYFGYSNFEPYAFDPYEAEAFMHVLREPCMPGITACGFKLTHQAVQAYRLRKSLPGGRSVTVDLRYSALTIDDNRNSGELATQQEAASHRIRQKFNQAIRESDVVLYLGHARYGGGMGFFPANLVNDALNIVFRNPLRGSTDALRASRKIKAFGVLGCETEGHYRASLEAANPNVDLILNKHVMTGSTILQVAIGTIDSILRERCAPELKAALTTDVDARDKKDNLVGAKEDATYFRGAP